MNGIDTINTFLESASPEQKLVYFRDYDLKGKEDYYLWISRTDINQWVLYYDDVDGEANKLLIFDSKDIKVIAYNIIRVSYYTDLDDLTKRLQDDYNGIAKFNQDEMDHLMLFNILELLESHTL